MGKYIAILLLKYFSGCYSAIDAESGIINRRLRPRRCTKNAYIRPKDGTERESFVISYAVKPNDLSY